MYDIYKIIEDFVEVCKYAEINITKNDIVIEILEAGVTHLQNSLPKDNMAVYIFLNKRKDLCYKVGKVGVKSNDRYKYHHYNSNSSKSNLAASILKDPDFNGIIEIQKSIKTWIKNNTTRINLLLKSDMKIMTLNLLEIFIQIKLNPKYEGYNSQR